MAEFVSVVNLTNCGFQIKTPAQLDAALSFLSTLGPDPLDTAKFEETCGVGTLCLVEITFIFI